MMRINQTNISAFIAHLFRARKGEEPPQAVLDSWQGLSNPEIAEHLRKLFENWGYTAADAAAAMDNFLASQPGSSPVGDAPLPQATPDVLPTPVPPATPDAGRPIYTPPPAPAYVPPTPAYTPPTTPAYAPPAQPYMPPPPASAKGRGAGRWVAIAIVSLLALVGAYAGYQYLRYQGLKRVFTITDNVAIRDQEGGVVGRMDVYAAKGSFASLRALDASEYPLTVDGKEYTFRKVLTDSATFGDYLLHKEGSTRYVSAGYLTENQGDYQRYRDVFRAINNNAKESSRLTSGYRQVIIGSLAVKGDLSLYVDNVCNNQRTDLTSVWKYQAAGSQVKVAAARMSDGQYYLFAGNTGSGVYEAPVPLMYAAASQGEQPLQGRDMLFGQDKTGRVQLYECSGSNTSFFATPDGEGKIKTFQWGNDPYGGGNQFSPRQGDQASQQALGNSK